MKKFKIRNEKGLKIIGDVLIPKKPIGLVFVLHGLGGFRQQNHIQIITRTFFKNNYTVVNFDATNSFGESGGKYENATMQTYYEDLVDVITWVKTQVWYKEPFILVGHSMGGYAVARYAENFPKEIKAVFPYAPVVSGELSYQKYKKYKPEEFKKWEKTGWRKEKSKSLPGIIKKLPWSHMKERLKHDLCSGALMLNMPVLLVVGENDTSCPPEHQKIFFDLLPGPKEMHVISGAPHTFREKNHLNELRKIIEIWIKNFSK